MKSHYHIQPDMDEADAMEIASAFDDSRGWQGVLVTDSSGALDALTLSVWTLSPSPPTLDYDWAGVRIVVGQL